MRRWIPFGKQTAPDTNQRIFISHQFFLAKALQSDIDFVGPRQQRHAAAPDGSDDSLKLDILRVQTAVKQLIPGWVHWVGQPSETEPRCPPDLHNRREIRWVTHPFNLPIFSNLRQVTITALWIIGDKDRPR